jgi:hypothetical protein
MPNVPTGATPSTAIELLKIFPPSASQRSAPAGVTAPLGVIVLNEGDQIRGGRSRLVLLAKDVGVTRLVVVVALKTGSFSLTSHLADEGVHELVVDLASARLAAAALRSRGRVPRSGVTWTDRAGTPLDLEDLDLEVKPKPCTIWSPVTVGEELSRRNTDVRRMLAECFNSGMGVIPFVGAGLSAPFKFPQWGELLTSLATGKRKAAVVKLVTAGRFEEAAQRLPKARRIVFSPRSRESSGGSFARRSSETAPSHCCRT